MIIAVILLSPAWASIEFTPPLRMGRTHLPGGWHDSRQHHIPAQYHTTSHHTDIGKVEMASHPLAIILAFACLLGPLSHDTFGVPQAANPAIPVKVLRYCQRLVRLYDQNGNGQLEEDEWSQMPGLINKYDADGDQVLDEQERDQILRAKRDLSPPLVRDGIITVQELAMGIAKHGRDLRIRLMFNPSADGAADYISLLGVGSRNLRDRRLASPNTEIDPDKDGRNGSSLEKGRPAASRFFVPKSQLPQGLPKWFNDFDANGDAQVSLAEFAPNATRSELQEFAHYDRNGDGVIVARECLGGPKSGRDEAAEEMTIAAEEMTIAAEEMTEAAEEMTEDAGEMSEEVEQEAVEQEQQVEEETAEAAKPQARQRPVKATTQKYSKTGKNPPHPVPGSIDKSARQSANRPIKKPTSKPSNKPLKSAG